ncbi:DDE-3 domain-containing protein [Mycena sanguinolenta]|uniref:DDE-3 domain-containing protein n=1 Tax=Mycena sanguinolenta TaxID=230812 RepID=A0A8H6Z353_9AGAR|nr:DDE-3 domain-containing protein [Mycena sanguinolenta]
MTTISPFKHTSLNRRTLERNYKEVKAHGGDLYFNNRKGNAGRLKAISDRDLEEAIRRIDAGEFVDGEDVRREMLPDVPGRTIRHVLSSVGLHGYVQRVKPNLQPRHVQQREQMYNKFAAWTDPRVFAQGVMINSDESKIELKTGTGRRWCHRRHGENVLAVETVQPREAHGLRGIKINVWGAIHPNGVSELVQVEGNLTAVQYVDILDRALVPLYDHYENRQHTFLYFQQDNDPKHTSKLAKAWFRDQGVTVFPWPAKSPDVSPIENAWAHLKREIRQHPRYAEVQSADMLFQLAREIWTSPDFKAYAIHLYNSFPRRLEALKENNFLWIDY